MFHHPAWAVGSYSSGPLAVGTPQIKVNPTQVRQQMGHPVHGGPSSRGQPFVGIAIRVALLSRNFILWLDFKFINNKQCTECVNSSVAMFARQILWKFPRLVGNTTADVLPDKNFLANLAPKLLTHSVP